MRHYLQGLYALKRCLPDNVEILNTFSTLEMHLLDNLHRERLPDRSQDEPAERARLLQELEALARRFCGKSFQQISSVDDGTSKVPALSTENSGLSTNVSSEAGLPLNMTWPIITYALFSPVIPVAYYSSTRKHGFPFITFYIDNSGERCTDVRLSLSVQIEGFSNEDQGYIEIAQGHKKEDSSLLPTLLTRALQTLGSPQQASLRITIHYHYPYEEVRTIIEPIHLHAYNTALLAQRNEEGKIIDLTRSLAAWVTPYHVTMEQLLSRAAERYNQGHSFPGYYSSDRQQRAQSIRKQAKAIFEMLKQEIKPHYVVSALNFNMDKSQITQRVRLPASILVTGGSMNCLDGTVLFASLLELASLHPLIIIIPGHAFVGWKLDPEEKQYECLETTLIREATFEEAVQVAMQSLKTARRKNDFSRPLFDEGGFARVIDIAECRARRVTPLE